MRVKTNVITNNPERPDYKIGDLVQNRDNDELVAIITDVSEKKDQLNNIFLLSLTQDDDSGYELGGTIAWEDGDDWKIFSGTLTIKCW